MVWINVSFEWSPRWTSQLFTTFPWYDEMSKEMLKNLPAIPEALFFWSSLCLCRFWNSGPWEKWIPAKEQTGVDVLLQADIKLSLFIFILISGMGLCVFLLMQCRIEPFRTIGWPHFARCAWADSLVFHCFGHTFEPEIPQKQSDKLFGRPVSQSRFTNKLIRIRNAPLGSMFLRHYFWKNMRK